jgi:triosephosphate isomerase
MARRKLIAGNWKMNPTLAKGLLLARDVVNVTHGVDADILVIPPTAFLGAVHQVLAQSHVGLGAQNLHPERAGAYTGEVSGGMLAEMGVSSVLCGHSERRELFGESPDFVGAKVAAAHREGLIPILCVGETLEARDAGTTEQVVAAQLQAGLASLLPVQIAMTVIAYEPVWAIGTGRNATAVQAQAVHAFIRGWLRARIGEHADDVRILYGGSVKASNARELLAEPDVDGALVGGASLDAEGFGEIAKAIPPR